MGDVMDEIRAEAKRRGQEREAREKSMKQQAQMFMDMDRKPDRKAEQKPAAANRGSGGSSSSSAAAAPPAADRSPEPNQQASGAIPPTAGGAVGSTAAPGAGPETDFVGGPNAVVMEGGMEIPLCGCGFIEGNVGQQLFELAGLKAPTERSFDVFYKEWFEEVYFPAMSKRVSKELVSRAQTKGFFSGLSSQVKKWAMANTDARLQAEVWYAYFLQYNPPQYKTYGCIRSATVNLGSAEVPCLTTFWGVRSGDEDHWKMSPLSSAEPDISSVMDELDTRGGMAALLSSAA